MEGEGTPAHRATSVFGTFAPEIEILMATGSDALCPFWKMKKANKQACSKYLFSCVANGKLFVSVCRTSVFVTELHPKRPEAAKKENGQTNKQNPRR